MPRSWFGKKKPGTSAADIALWVAGRATSASGRSQSLELPLQPSPTAAALLLLLNATVSPIASTPAKAAVAVAIAIRRRRRLASWGAVGTALGGGAIRRSSSSTPL